jgi:hypothetical protein
VSRTGRLLVARAVAVPVAVVAVVLGASGLAGCRDVERTALPALPAPPARSAPAAPSADPLAGIEAGVDAVERAVDADVGPATGR